MTRWAWRISRRRREWRIAPVPLLISALVLAAMLTAAHPAAGDALNILGEWQYREIVTGDAVPAADANSGENEQGVLFSNLQAMPLNLLGRVFGKIDYTASFAGDQRFAIRIKVMRLRFTAQGSWSTQSGQITLCYDEITGFEKLWWIGGFDHLTHCDAEHTLTETVSYTVTDDTLTLFSNGACIVFACR